MTKIFHVLAVLAAVLCVAACGQKAEARYDLLESDILVWEHARNPAGEDVIIVTLLPESSERFNAFAQANIGKVIDIYLGPTLLSSPEIRGPSTSNLIYLAGFEGRDFKRMVDGLPVTKRKTE